MTKINKFLVEVKEEYCEDVPEYLDSDEEKEFEAKDINIVTSTKDIKMIFIDHFS